MADNPELQQLLAMSRDRTAYQNPLFQAVTQMAYRGLPTYAREGTQLSGTLSNQAPPAQGSGGGGMNPLLAGGIGAGLGALAGNGNALGALIEGLKKLFGHGGRNTVQGDSPYGGGALTGPGFDPNGFTGWDPSVSDPSGNPYLLSDPGFYTGMSVNDPSGGTGIGPGMQAFRQSGGSETPTGNWWEE